MQLNNEKYGHMTSVDSISTKITVSLSTIFTGKCNQFDSLYASDQCVERSLTQVLVDAVFFKTPITFNTRFSWLIAITRTDTSLLIAETFIVRYVQGTLLVRGDDDDQLTAQCDIIQSI